MIVVIALPKLIGSRRASMSRDFKWTELAATQICATAERRRFPRLGGFTGISGDIEDRQAGEQGVVLLAKGFAPGA
jgi:hypothetical protein